MSTTTGTQRRVSRAGAGVPSRAVAALLGCMLLSSCQSVIEQTYEPKVSPSSNPQIVEEVQKNDPRAQVGAREHRALSQAMAANIRMKRPSALLPASPAR